MLILFFTTRGIILTTVCASQTWKIYLNLFFVVRYVDFFEQMNELI